MQMGKGRARFTPVANFTARIVRDLIVDDEAEPGREFTVEADLEGQRISFPVPAADFGRMAWVLNRLGPRAIVYPGQQQHARAAIQSLSGAVPEERITTRMGWHRHGPDWVYLQGGGALGGRGIIDEAGVRLRRRWNVIGCSRQGTRVPASMPSGRVCVSYRWRRTGSVCRCWLPYTERRWGTWISVCFWRVPAASSRPLWRRFVSSTSARKWMPPPCPRISARRRAHWKSWPSRRATHCSWSTTSCRWKERARARCRGAAERLFRAVGNRQGRGRMGGYGRLRLPRPPRALLLATGEEVPRGRSLRARLLIVELRAGEVDLVRIEPVSECRARGTASGGNGHISELDCRTL